MGRETEDRYALAAGVVAAERPEDDEPRVPLHALPLAGDLQEEAETKRVPVRGCMWRGQRDEPPTHIHGPCRGNPTHKATHSHEMAHAPPFLPEALAAGEDLVPVRPQQAAAVLAGHLLAVAGPAVRGRRGAPGRGVRPGVRQGEEALPTHDLAAAEVDEAFFGGGGL